MIDLEKFNINLDKRLVAQILFYSAIVISVAGFLMFLNGFNRFSISGIRKDSGRVEFEFYDNYLYMFSHNTESYAPITDVKYYKSDSKDNPDNPLLVFFTTTDEFRFYAKENDIDDEDLRELHKEINAFMDDEEIVNFGESFFYLRFYGLFGLLLAGLIGYYILPLYKQIPALPKPKKVVKGKDKSTDKVVKKVKKIKKVKKVITSEMLLKILVPVYDKNFTFKPEIYDTQFTLGVALACTPAQKIELVEEYEDDYEYIVCDKNTGTAEMTAKAEGWLKDFTGYLIVQTGNIPELSSSMVADFYKNHKSVQNEFSILSTETSESSIPTGKIMRNMANRISSISETNESNENDFQAAQISLGLFCFNSKKVFDTVKSLSHGNDLSGIPLSRITEKYHKNRNKMSTYVVKTVAKQAVISNASATKENIVLPSQKAKAIILSVMEFNVEKLKNSYEALSPEIENIYVVLNSTHQDEAKKILGENVTFVLSEGKMGDADDVLKVNDHLRNFNGLVIVVTEDIVDISKEKIGKLLSDHTSQSNICSYVKHEDNNILYCTDAFQFLYAVRMIGRNPEDRKYHLSDMLNILVEAKKRVQEVEM